MISIDDYDGEGYADNEQIDIEQAHITYSLDNGVSFTIGKYGSALGFEREDPAGLYTYSRAYSGVSIDDDGKNLFNLGDVDTNVVEGLTIAYANDTFSIGASFENGAEHRWTVTISTLKVALHTPV